VNILRPSIGDLYDRLTILELKLRVQNRQHWSEEQESILRRLAPTFSVGLASLVDALRTTNTNIWLANDIVAQLAKKPHPQPNQMAVEMWKENQERIRLIAEINKACGQPTSVEKAY